MESGRFDALTRAVAAPKTRRGFLGGIAALGAGLLAARGAGAQPITQAYCGNTKCKKDPSKCRDGCVCCVWSNGNSRCTPPGQCGAGGVVVGGGGNPDQGTCRVGANACVNGQSDTCNGSSACGCVQTLTGSTVCVGGSVANVGCSSDAECRTIFGAPAAYCFVATGEFCPAEGRETACALPCGATQPT